jgi:hypothetical protein
MQANDFAVLVSYIYITHIYPVLFIYLFTCSLFYNDFPVTNYIVPNRRVISV